MFKKLIFVLCPSVYNIDELIELSMPGYVHMQKLLKYLLEKNNEDSPLPLCLWQLLHMFKTIWKCASLFNFYVLT